MNAEEFVLISKRIFLDNPIYKQKAPQISLLQRNNSTDFESKKATEQETKKTKIVNKKRGRRARNVDLKNDLDDESDSVQSFSNNDGKIEPVLKKDNHSLIL